MASLSSPRKSVAFLGNPNVGKTTIFNQLTGLRLTTGNYPGVTVEKVVGPLKLPSQKEIIDLIDLPGTYSLDPQTMDEEVVKHVLLGEQKGVEKPDAIVIVIDSNNFGRNLYLAFQVMELGFPVIFAMNMWDAVEESQRTLDLEKLEKMFGIRCVKTVGNRGQGIDELKDTIEEVLDAPKKAQIDFAFKDLSIEERYEKIDCAVEKLMTISEREIVTVSDKIDSVLTHPFFGWIIFIGLMSIIFQSIFTWATPFMDLISSGVDFASRFVSNLLPEGQLKSLVVDGVIAGVGNVVIFLPQIFLLFFFIAFFEDFGYMARAAFVLDRVMKKVGLNGKAFLPLLSSFACAIPGIMATRTIKDRNDRMATILVAPLMSCSARLPVYTLMIGAFIPSVSILGIFNLKGITLLAMYFLSIFAGLGMAALFRKTLLKGYKTPFLLELPPYRIPRLRTVLLTMWDKGYDFLKSAGTIIFGISIILWFLVSYPKNDEIALKYQQIREQSAQSFSIEQLETKNIELHQAEASEQLRESYAGRLGLFIEPLIKPLGFDWKIGIGLVASFAAREVLVSTLAIIYNVGEDANEASVDLIQALQNEKDMATGQPRYTPLVAVSLMVFFVLACQCMSTVAIVKRETNSWRWPIFMVSYMTALAWFGSFAVYQGGRLLGMM
jgi:ferrous iron transport protein B